MAHRFEASVLVGAAIACVAGCGDDSAPSDAGAGDSGAPGERWQVVFEDLDGALMSVAGSSPDDVWAVGSDTRDGEGALALRYDGEGWTRIETGVEADLWWVHVFARDEVLAGGTGGTLLRYEDGALSTIDTPGSATVWGIWGASDDDVWVVGGDVEISPGFVWHFDGETVEDRTSELPEALREQVFFKVWGRSAGDVWLVGMDGAAAHWDGEAFEQGDADTGRRLFTVHGPPSGEPPFVAVGGFGDGVIIERSGTQWHNTTPSPAPLQLYGVFMERSDHGYAVGYDAIVLEYDGTAWNMLDTGYESFDPLHAVWVDREGEVWAVGGDIISPAPSAGMLLKSGETISDEISN